MFKYQIFKQCIVKVKITRNTTLKRAEKPYGGSHFVPPISTPNVKSLLLGNISVITMEFLLEKPMKIAPGHVTLVT